MDNFEAALRISYENWIDSIPDDPEPFEHSKKYDKEIQKLCDKMRNDKLHTFTRRTARTLLIAAILLLIATVAFASTVGRDFIIRHFDGFATYSVTDTSNAKDIDDLTLNYIPEGFELTYNKTAPLVINYSYQYDDKWFNISKLIIFTDATFDIDYTYEKEFEKNGIVYHYFNKDNLNTGVIWNNGDFQFILYSNLDENELLKIAENID